MSLCAPFQAILKWVEACPAPASRPEFTAVTHLRGLYRANSSKDGSRIEDPKAGASTEGFRWSLESYHGYHMDGEVEALRPGSAA